MLSLAKLCFLLLASLALLKTGNGFVQTLNAGSSFVNTKTGLFSTATSGNSYVNIHTTGDGLTINDPSNGYVTVPILPPLRNSYYALRHGQSLANLEGIISSDVLVGTTRHGLTSSGRAQARKAAVPLLSMIAGDGFTFEDLVFISSNFTRARETAEETIRAIDRIIEYEEEPVATELPSENVPSHQIPLAIFPGLRERYFGELDGTVLPNYNKVWPEDVQNAQHSGYGVESVNDVCRRIEETILEIDQQYQNKAIVLTSHADTLQITQCYLAGVDPRLFSQYRFKNAEVRKLAQDPSCIPSPMPLSYQ
uniref:Phosphoglycerate mutase n=1 Tax=Heterosigma akashiwo TaxID=2829 RepID=A0A6V1VLS3_HETAK